MPSVVNMGFRGESDGRGSYCFNDGCNNHLVEDVTGDWKSHGVACLLFCLCCSRMGWRILHHWFFRVRIGH